MVPPSVPSDTFAPKVCFAPATPLSGAVPPKLPLQRLALLLLSTAAVFIFASRTSVAAHKSATSRIHQVHSRLRVHSFIR